MGIRSPLRRLAVALTTAVLLVLAWGAVAGAVDQWPRAGSPWQKIQTAVQALFGAATLLIPLTPFSLRQWKRTLRAAWSVTAAAAAGLSALVWGPPMPLLAILFAAVAAAVTWALALALDGFSG